MTTIENIQIKKSICFNKIECELIDKAFSQDSTARIYTKKGGFWHTYRNNELLAYLEVSAIELKAICHSLHNIVKVGEILIPIRSEKEKLSISVEILAASSIIFQIEGFLNANKLSNNTVFSLLTENGLLKNNN